MKPKQAWLLSHNSFKFRCSNRVYIKSVNQHGVVVAVGSNDDKHSYMIRLDGSTPKDELFQTIEDDLESSPEHKGG